MEPKPQRPARADEPTGPMTPLDASTLPGEALDDAPFADTRADPERPPSTGPGDRLRELVGGEERADWRRRLITALTVGLGGWLSFFLVDLVEVFALRRAPWVPYLMARGVPALGLGLVLLEVRRRERLSEWMLRGLEVVAFATGTAAVGVLAVLHDDGIRSTHVAGSVLVLLSYGVTLGMPWRHALLPVLSMTLGLPAVLATAALVSDRIAAQWSNPSIVLEFVDLYSVVIGGAVLTLIGGHLISGVKREAARVHSIGRYRLRRRIATGGMGEIWAAYHAGLGRDVAVKLIRAGRTNERDVRRFEREVRATAELTHPNTVRVFDYGATDDGVFYYAMELLEADNLQRYVDREGPLDAARAMRLATQAAQALGEAHARGIVHRDIKPSNLLLQQPGSGSEYVKLIDFGIARRADAAGELTATGVVIGTPGYIAPEVVGGAPADARADVYALGAVLYFLLVGRMPFEGDTAQAVVLSHLHKEVPPPSRDAPHPVPSALDAIVLRCMEKEPASRFADGEELARTLLER